MMASAPCFRERCSFDSHGSGSLRDEYSPQRLYCGSRSLNGDIYPDHLSSGAILTDFAAPVHPFDGDDGFSELSSDASGSSSPPLCRAQLSERHVLLCFKEPESWPPVVEGADSDRLPRYLAAAIKTRKNEMMKKTRFLICEGRDGTDTSNGDVMIYPDMVCYRGLTHFDVEAFVDEVLVRNREWLPGRPERLLGAHIFVCAHGSHEVKFGELGPAIIEKFSTHLASRGLRSSVFLKPCSYIGGYKFTRSLIVYSTNSMGDVLGHSYGCVTLDNFSSVLDDLYIKGHLPAEKGEASFCSPSKDCGTDACSALNGNYCHHECCVGHANGEINPRLDGCTKVHTQKFSFVQGLEDSSQQKRRMYASSSWWQASWWLCFWEKEDTLATLVAIGAGASVCLAYHLYKSHSRP